MARRTLTEIIDQIKAEQAAQTELAGLNSPSSTSIYGLWRFITAWAIWFHEGLWDIKQAAWQSIIDNAPVGTDSWLQDQSFKFQYDSTTPQILSLVDFVPTYTTVDATKRIISQCSVKTLPNRLVSIKVAKNSPPEKLATPELTSYQGYLDNIAFAGVQYIATSTDPDYVSIDADITYEGQYSSSISGLTITSINNYLRNIPFDGNIKLVSLVDAIQSTSGVTDCVLNNVTIRANTIPFSGATYLVQNNQTIYSRYPLYAGYVVQDSTPNDFAATLTFIPE